jgi:hypothetical protein
MSLTHGRVDEIFNQMMMNLHFDDYEQNMSPNWERSMATISWDKPTPSFQECAAKNSIDLNDDIMCYAIAAIHFFNLNIDIFMRCVVTNILSEDDLFSQFPQFWRTNVNFLYLMSESNTREWSGIMGADIPGTMEGGYYVVGSDEFNHNRNLLDRLITCIEDTLDDTWHDYVDQWAEWLVYYIDRTANISVALQKMSNSLRAHGKLFAYDYSRGVSWFRPSTQHTYNLEAKVYALKKTFFLWQRIRDLVAVRPYVKVLWECVAMTQEERRIALAIDGIVDDPLRQCNEPQNL